MAPISTLTVKLQAQIAEFQGEFKEAQKDVQKFHDSFQTTATKASAYGNLIARGLEIGIQTLGNLARQALESASKIEDMSRKTGLSMEAIQEFQHVADQTGTTLEAFSSAAFQLGTRLAGGGQSVVSAVEDLGLEFKALRDLRPAEQFDLIAEALGRMENPQERNRLGLELFGRRFQEIAPAIAEGYRDLADGAAKMSDDTVRRLANAEDAWAKLSRKVTIVSGEILAATFTAVDRATRSWENFFRSFNPGQMAQVLAEEMEREATASIPTAPGAPAIFDLPSLGASRQALLDMVDPVRKVDVELAKLRSTTTRVSEAKREFKSVIDSSTNSLRLFTGEIPGTEVALKSLFDIIPPDPPDLAGKLVQGFEGLSNLPGVKIDLADFIPPLEPTFFQKFFGADFGRQLGNIIGGAFRGGGVMNAISDAASLIGSTLLSGLAKNLTTGANAITGWLGGMISAALPAIGALLGPLVDKIAGMFDRNKGRDLVKDFAASFGGFDSLHDRLLELGSAGEALWIKLTQGVGRNNPEQAAAVIAEIEEALGELGTEAERAAARLDAIGVAMDGVNTKAELFAAPFQALIDKQKEGKITQDEFTASLAAMGEKGQAEFERIGVFAAAAFAGMVKETGDAIGALDRLSPALSVLQQGLKDFGLTSTGTIDALLGLFKLVHDETTGPILQAIQATGQIFAGLQDAGLLTADLFQTVSDDIGAAFRELEAKGGDVAKAMALSQPVLQRLWEAQQIYGDVTDETTRKLLEQAEQQGIVGAHMKDVNQKILDVLLAIADVFGAKIPDSMRATRQAASDTASRIEDEFSKIKIPTIYVPVDFEYPDGAPHHDRVPFLADGGIVRKRTLAVIGESGPEAVIPLSQIGSVAPEAGSTTVILQMDGRDVAEVVVPHIPGVARRYVTV